MVRSWKIEALIDYDPEQRMTVIRVSATHIYQALALAQRTLQIEHDQRKPNRDSEGKLFREPEIVSAVRESL